MDYAVHIYVFLFCLLKCLQCLYFYLRLRCGTKRTLDLCKASEMLAAKISILASDARARARVCVCARAYVCACACVR